MMKMNRRVALAGFTLIEVMIATAITGIVMASLIEVFAAQQKMYYRQTSLVRAQANARASLAIVSREIRMAGYTGLPLGFAHLNDALMGTGPGSIYPVMWLQNNGTALGVSTGDTLVKTSGAIANSIEAVSGATKPPGGTNPTDAFEILGNFSRGITSLSSNLAEGEAVTQITIPATGLHLFQNTGFNRPAYVAVGNNDRTEIFTFVSSPPPGTGTGTGTVVLMVSGTSKAEYKPTTLIGGNMVLPIFRRAYFVNTKTIPDSAGAITGTLMVGNYDAAGAVTGGNNPVELARDVQEFQVSYDVRVANPGGVVWTVPQDTFADPCAVAGVRLRIRNKGWESADQTLKMARDLISVVRIRNSGIGQANCPVGISLPSP